MQVPRTSAVRKRRFRLNRSQFVLRPDLWRPFPIRGQAEQLASLIRNPRQSAAYIFILVGTVLCTYVVGTYVWMYAQQKILLHKFKHSAQSAPLTEISIPRIKLEDVVLEGVSDHSLLLGPAHLSQTAELGAIGNAAIAGHRDTFFRHVHSLRYGDDIYIVRGGKQFHYVVRTKRVVEPTNMSVLNPTKDSELTLITCWPTHAIGPAPQRLIVVAKLVNVSSRQAGSLANRTVQTIPAPAILSSTSPLQARSHGD
jgi:LPXTG-site transpeptidase (sortase) family protein